MKSGDKVKLNDKARKLPFPQSANFQPGDKGTVTAIVGSLYVRVEFKKKGSIRVPKGWLDYA